MSPAGLFSVVTFWIAWANPEAATMLRSVSVLTVSGWAVENGRKVTPGDRLDGGALRLGADDGIVIVAVQPDLGVVPAAIVHAAAGQVVDDGGQLRQVKADAQRPVLQFRACSGPGHGGWSRYPGSGEPSW
jgi:hypothetical protein